MGGDVVYLYMKWLLLYMKGWSAFLKWMIERLRLVPNRFYESFLIENTIATVGQINGVLFTSYLLYLNLQVGQMALLIAFIGLSQLVQIFSTTLYRIFHHKKRIIFILRGSRSVLLLITGFVPLLVEPKYYYVVLFGLMLLSSILLNSVGGAFLEWNDAYIDSSKKGSYYGFRNVLLNASFIITSFIFGMLLDRFDNSYLLYVVVFSIPVFLTVFDWLILKDVPFPAQDEHLQEGVFQTMVAPLKDKTYRNFIIFSIIWTMALGLGRPLLNIYVIGQLKYSYTIIAFAGSAAAFVKVFSGISFGKTVDTVGAYKVVTLCGILFSGFTFLYIFLHQNTQIVYTLIIIFNGIVMIGFNIGLFNYNITLAKGPRMNAYLSTAGFFSGLATFLSTIFSGFVVDLFMQVRITIGVFRLDSYQCLFILSSIVHLVAILFFIKTMKEKPIYGKSKSPRIG